MTHLNPLFLLTSRKSIFGKIAILSYFWLFFELFVKLHKKMTSDKNIKGHFLCSCSYKFLVSKLFYLMFQAKKFAPFYAKVYYPRTIFVEGQLLLAFFEAKILFFYSGQNLL